LLKVVLCAGGLACASDTSMNGDSCLQTLPLTCEPSLPASYDELYQQVFSQRCGVSGSGTSCHGRDGLKGNLGLFDAQSAYKALTGADMTRARVLPGDPACSLLMQRLESQDASFRMPLGESPLSAGVRCAVQTWIEQGALMQ
jgi:hypothetical protein